jgi:predicted AAA+ superfamily ATPase
MVVRDIQDLLHYYGQQFRSVMLVGPRQSGKTTLAKMVFPAKKYVSLENPDERNLALTDPKAFLNRFPNGAILDEVQRAPELLNYLQEILDNTTEDGLFILTGSNNLLLQENVSQTLAGRIGVLDLYPLSYRELQNQDRQYTLNELLLRGFYPEIHQKNRNPDLWYQSYVRTYVERDVRQLKNIDNAMLFFKFLRLCAGRVDQTINRSALSNECGIDVKTVDSWLSILEKTFVIKMLPTYFNNFNKRLVKTPKLYFVDTGLACSLLSIKKESELEVSHFRGSLVENLIIMEFVKNNANLNLGHQFYFWRDNKGLEIDLIVQTANQLIATEIKSAQTFSSDFIKGLKKFNALSGETGGVLIYDGEMEFTSQELIKVVNWKSALTD